MVEILSPEEVAQGQDPFGHKYEWAVAICTWLFNPTPTFAQDGLALLQLVLVVGLLPPTGKNIPLAFVFAWCCGNND